jgi:hypothetical protein
MTKDLYIQRILGRLEGFLKSNTSGDTQDLVLKSVNEFLESAPSHQLLERELVDFKFYLPDDRSHVFPIPSAIFLVDGYNKFNLEETFKEKY